MSRIAGILSDQPAETRERLLTRMLQVFTENGVSSSVIHETCSLHGAVHRLRALNDG